MTASDSTTSPRHVAPRTPAWVRWSQADQRITFTWTDPVRDHFPNSTDLQGWLDLLQDLSTIAPELEAAIARRAVVERLKRAGVAAAALGTNWSHSQHGLPWAPRDTTAVEVRMVTPDFIRLKAIAAHHATEVLEFPHHNPDRVWLGVLVDEVLDVWVTASADVDVPPSGGVVEVPDPGPDPHVNDLDPFPTTVRSGAVSGTEALPPAQPPAAGSTLAPHALRREVTSVRIPTTVLPSRRSVRVLAPA